MAHLTVELSFSINQDSPVSLYWQVYEQARAQILAGKVGAGERLPPTRELAERLGVARVTVTQAYKQLAAEGFVQTRTGAGTFVVDSLPSPLPTATAVSPQPYAPSLSDWGRRVTAAQDIHQRSNGPRTGIDFGFGRSFPHLFPYDVWRRLLARYLSTDDTMLSRYGSVAGFYPLRQALADYLERLRGVQCTPEQVVVVSGAQQALDLLSRLLLTPDDGVLVETPGYVAAYTLFHTHGARLESLPVDEKGFPVAQIPPDCQARLVFVTPSNQFPSGGAMPLARRLALLQWARDHDALVIEDDYDGELRYDNHPLTALQGLDEDGRVVYLGTFSKVLFPALRLAYVVLPEPLCAPFIQAKAIVDRGAPTLTQAAVADFITEGHFESHLRHLRQAYGRRRRALITALEQHLPNQVCCSQEAAGLHVMLYLRPHLDEETVIARAAAAGVGVYPGAPYHLEQPAPPSILLGFSGLSEDDIRIGVERLAQVLINLEQDKA